MSNVDFDIPIVVTASGPVPTPPATLLAGLIAAVEAQVGDGYTANLPLSMIEDISSTDVGALTVCDTARVEAINSVTPYGSNEFTLAQLGQMFLGPGAAPAPPTNTSVQVQFTVTNTNTSAAQPGYLIPVGFTVSDGIYQYVVQDGGTSDSNGLVSLFCVSPTTGTWPVAPGSVDQVATSVPTPYAVACTNPLAGTSSVAGETAPQYRVRVVDGAQAVSQGMPTTLKALLGQVPNVQYRLISVVQNPGGGFEVLCGGGDPYQVAGAIYDAVLDVSTLVGSSLNVVSISQANPGVIVLDKNHGYATGQVFQVNGVLGMLPINGINLTATVVDEKTLRTGVNTTGFPAYAGGGVATPNFRNQAPNIIDYPDVYTVPFVTPPLQTVSMTVLWNTSEPDFVAGASVAQVAAPALAAYVNSIQAAQPINLLVARETFTAAVAGILQPSQISVLDFTVLINGVVTAPQSGTELVLGDPESYFETTAGAILVEQA